jgi:hypothetical protein
MIAPKRAAVLFIGPHHGRPTKPWRRHKAVRPQPNRHGWNARKKFSGVRVGATRRSVFRKRDRSAGDG